MIVKHLMTKAAAEFLKGVIGLVSICDTWAVAKNAGKSHTAIESDIIACPTTASSISDGTKYKFFHLFVGGQRLCKRKHGLFGDGIAT